MSKQKEVVILVGNIGTGKTTVAKKYINYGYIAIARDYLRYAIGLGEYRFDPNYEPIIWQTETYMYKKFVDLGVNIVIDEVGMSKKLRKKYIKYAKNRGYKMTAVVTENLSMKKAVDRRMKDPHGEFNRKIWEKVWTNFNKIYEVPTLKEGFDRIMIYNKTNVIYRWAK